MSVAYRKVWRDLWRNWSRTLLVVMSIATGVMALGMVLAANRVMNSQMSSSYSATTPAHAVLYLNQRVDDATLTALRRLPDVDDVQGVQSFSLNWKRNLTDEWESDAAEFIVIDDFTAQKYEQVRLTGGVWPTSKTVAVPDNHRTDFDMPELGGDLYFEINDRARSYRMVGQVYAAQSFSPPFDTRPVFYVDQGFALRTVGRSGYNEIRLRIPDYSPEQLDAAIGIAKDKLENQNVRVGGVHKNIPGEHPIQEIFNGVGMILSVMAVALLILSLFLVINTINAVIVQQVPQVGIMKTIGGVTKQISRLYLAGVAIYGLLSLCVAVPLGIFGANALAEYMLTIINVPTGGVQILPEIVALQFAAGLVTPILAGLWPIFQGAAVSVREALQNGFGGSGGYGSSRLDRALTKVKRLPRIVVLALRNTFRRMSRVLMTLLVLTLAGTVFMMVFATNASLVGTIDDIWEGFGFDVIMGFEKSQRIAEVVPLIESRPGIEAAEMWIWTSATGRKPGETDITKEVRVRIRAVPKESKLFAPQLVAGRALDINDEHALLLNQDIAGEYGYAVGDTIELDFGSDGLIEWQIVGLVADITSDQKTAYLHLEVFNKSLNQVGRASVAEIVTTDKTFDGQIAIQRDLETFFADQGVEVAWASSAGEDRAESQSQFNILINILLVMTVLMALVGSIGLSGTLSINIIERRREIGVMRAVGASSVDVALIFIIEGLLVGLASWVIAVPISMIAGRYFVQGIGVAIDFPAQYHIDTVGVWLWLGIVTLLSIVFSILPARKATQISVAQSLAYE